MCRLNIFGSGRVGCGFEKLNLCRCLLSILQSHGESEGEESVRAEAKIRVMVGFVPMSSIFLICFSLLEDLIKYCKKKKMSREHLSGEQVSGKHQPWNRWTFCRWGLTDR